MSSAQWKSSYRSISYGIEPTVDVWLRFRDPGLEAGYQQYVALDSITRNDAARLAVMALTHTLWALYAGSYRTCTLVCAATYTVLLVEYILLKLVPRKLYVEWRWLVMLACRLCLTTMSSRWIEQCLLTSLGTISSTSQLVRHCVMAGQVVSELVWSLVYCIPNSKVMLAMSIYTFTIHSVVAAPSMCVSLLQQHSSYTVPVLQPLFTALSRPTATLAAAATLQESLQETLLAATLQESLQEGRSAATLTAAAAAAAAATLQESLQEGWSAATAIAAATLQEQLPQTCMAETFLGGICLKQLLQLPHGWGCLKAASLVVLSLSIMLPLLLWVLFIERWQRVNFIQHHVDWSDVTVLAMVPEQQQQQRRDGADPQRSSGESSAASTAGAAAAAAAAEDSTVPFSFTNKGLLHMSSNSSSISSNSNITQTSSDNTAGVAAAAAASRRFGLTRCVVGQHAAAAAAAAGPGSSDTAACSAPMATDDTSEHDQHDVWRAVDIPAESAALLSVKQWMDVAQRVWLAWCLGLVAFCWLFAADF